MIDNTDIQRYNPSNTVKEGYVMDLEYGAVLCANCSRKRTKRVCPKCGYDSCWVRLRYQGIQISIWKGSDGKALTHSDAVAQLVTINQQIKDKEFDPARYSKTAINEKSLDALWDQFTTQKEKVWSPGTAVNARTYRKYIEPLADLDVRLIRLKHLQLFYEGLPKSEAHKQNIMKLLHTFFAWLVRWGEIDKVPIWPEYAPIVKVEGFALTPEDQVQILERIPAEHRDILEFAMDTGLRPGEVCALQVQDIDFNRRLMLVRRTWSLGQLRTTKEKKEGWRALSDRACEIIEKQVRVESISPATRFLFINPLTRRGYRPKTLRWVWKKFAGVDVRFYEGTRHSWVTQMIEAGAQPMELGIHSNTNTTRNYFHPSSSRQHELANRRGKVITFGQVSGREPSESLEPKV